MPPRHFVVSDQMSSGAVRNGLTRLHSEPTLVAPPQTLYNDVDGWIANAGPTIGTAQRSQQNSVISSSLNTSNTNPSHYAPNPATAGSSGSSQGTPATTSNSGPTPSTILDRLDGMKRLQGRGLREQLEQIIISQTLRSQAISLSGNDAVSLIDLLQEVGIIQFLLLLPRCIRPPFSIVLNELGNRVPSKYAPPASRHLF